MALSQQELATLDYFCTDHNSLSAYIAAQDWPSIEIWFTEVPSVSLETVITLLSPYEKYRLFSVIGFPEWYSSYCLKVHEEVDLVPVLGLTTADFAGYLDTLLGLILLYGLTSHSLHDIVAVAFKRNMLDLIQVLLVCFASDGILYGDTLLHIKVETATYPRWLSLGLTSSPTAAELQAVLSN